MFVDGGGVVVQVCYVGVVGWVYYVQFVVGVVDDGKVV